MLKRIVIFLKTQVSTHQASSNLFTQRFSEDDTHADQHQWNGGRHLTTKELQSFNNEPGIKSTVQHVS